jgi:hypothetical protein
VVPRRGRRWKIVCVLALGGVVVGCCGFVVAGGSARSTAGSSRVAQLEFPAVLAAPGEPLEVGYDTRRIPAASGFLYVRNDTQRAFMRVRLQTRKASQQLVANDGLRVLRAAVPASVVRGHKLFYYAVLRLGPGAAVRIPARSSEKVWVLTGARFVKLGTHRFGNLRQAAAVVAHAGPADVGFDNPPEGAKSGPWSFDVAPNRSVWLLDELSRRLLVWPAGQPDAAPRVVPLGSGGWDFARGPAGSVYVTRRAPESFTLQLFRVTATGHVTWHTDLATDIENQQLRLGPDGTLYWTGAVTGSLGRRTERAGPNIWAPAASPAGQPFSTDRQKRRLTLYQPLPGGRRLVWTIADLEKDRAYGLAPHEERVALFRGANRLVRAWRIQSRTVIWPYPEATPGLVGSNPVVVLKASTSSSPTKTEYEVLRLAATSSGTLDKFSLPSASYTDQGGIALWGDVQTDIRIGPGAVIYQLGTSPTVGVRIFRYPL